MEEKGWEIARKILEVLGYRVEQLSRSPTTPYPYDLLAVRGKEHLLIDVKYAEGDQGSAGFPAPWIRRAHEELYKKGASGIWKARVLFIAKHGDHINYLFLEPRFEKPWFKLDD